MGQLADTINNITLIVISIAAGLSIVMFGYAGIQYMTSQGDPNAMGRAKMSVIMSVIGLIIAGMAFLIPAVIGRTVVEPMGGRLLVKSTSVHCDQYLKLGLISNPVAHNPDTIQALISSLQATKEDCDPQIWNPVVHTGPTVAGQCFSGPQLAEEKFIRLGGVHVPQGLDESNDTVRKFSGRSSEGDIIVYWHISDASQRPSDNAMCWLYSARVREWVTGY